MLFSFWMMFSLIEVENRLLISCKLRTTSFYVAPMENSKLECWKKAPDDKGLKINQKTNRVTVPCRHGKSGDG